MGVESKRDLRPKLTKKNLVRVGLGGIAAAGALVGVKTLESQVSAEELTADSLGAAEVFDISGRPDLTPEPYQESQEEIIEKAWEAYSKDEALLSKPVTVKFQEVTSFDDRIRLIAQNPWYFGELSSKVAEIVQRPEMEEPYNYKDLEDIYGGFAFHPSNEDGFVVFYTLPKGAQVKGILSCDSALTPGLELVGVSEGQGSLYPQDYYFKYKKPMKVEVLVPLPEEGASEVVPVTVPAGAYLMPTDFWSITSDKRDFLPTDLYKIPEEPFQCPNK
jgi:hypothetical protein